MNKQERATIREQTKLSIGVEVGWKNEIVISLLDALDEADARLEAFELAIKSNVRAKCDTCKTICKYVCKECNGFQEHRCSRCPQVTCEDWQFDYEKFA